MSDQEQEQAGKGETSTPATSKLAQAEKLLRRLLGLPSGRYEMIITIGDKAILDWSVRPFGKVEQ